MDTIKKIHGYFIQALGVIAIISGIMLILSQPHGSTLSFIIVPAVMFSGAYGVAYPNLSRES